MNSSELRIGNYLQAKSCIVEVTRIFTEDAIGIGSGDPYQVSGDNPCLKPIPLTEEWLLKFGFEKAKGSILFDKGKLSIYLGDTILSGKNGRTYFNGWAIIEESPKHVHSLQNLYFALTGEELTLKES
jgi:hypothetical protein